MTKLLECTNRQRLIRFGIHTVWVVALSVSLNLSFAGLTRAEEPLLTIEKAVWTDGVSDRQHGSVYTDSAPAGPLFLWMSIRGKDGALKKLKEEQGKSSMIAAVSTLDDFIPNRQLEKIEVLKQRVRKISRVIDEDRETFEDLFDDDSSVEFY